MRRCFIVAFSATIIGPAAIMAPSDRLSCGWVDGAVGLRKWLSFFLSIMYDQILREALESKENLEKLPMKQELLNINDDEIGVILGILMVLVQNYQSDQLVN